MSLESKIIDYKDNEEDIKHWILLKGEFRYEVIIDILINNKIPTTWENVTKCVKYDKRLLINIFKYIVFLEEYFKSMIFKYKTIEKERLLKYEFSTTLNEFIKLDNAEIYDDMNYGLLKSEKDQIIDFRNSVVHNKILIGQSFKGYSLNRMIDIYTQILPKSYRDGFISDIKKCDKDLNVAKIVLY